MRTNVDIDEQLIRDVMKVMGVRTKREAVDTSLRRSLRAAEQLQALRELRGIGWEGNLDEMRTDKPLPSIE